MGVSLMVMKAAGEVSETGVSDRKEDRRKQGKRRRRERMKV